MLNQVITKVFGNKHERDVKRMQPMVAAVNALEPAVRALSDEALRGKTEEFRRELAGGKSLDDLLVPAFAVVREAARRVLGMRHYDVQLIGGMVLHQGKIAEMRTGEGKTLVATLPSYLNALAGKGVHIVTVNDYLARRDAEWMGRVHQFLGLTVGIVQHDISDVNRRAAYQCDITYCTNNELGFDYLRDNMKFDLAAMVQRGHYFAVVDEVDSILVDEARTPLIISGPSEESVDKYYQIDKIIPKLERGEEITDKDGNKSSTGDFLIDEKAHTVALTDQGVGRVEKLLNVDNLYDIENMDLIHGVNQGLRAHHLYRRDVEYLIKDGQVIIVDEFTGRMMPGRRWSDGLHQAVEAKEGVKIERENQTLATITFQNFFRMYEKLSGMTGTAMTESEEFFKIYNLEVVPLPTNIEYMAQQKKLIPQPDKFVDGTPITTYVEPKSQRKYFKRLDYPDLVYKNTPAKFQAVADEIISISKSGRPVLVGTIAIETSEMLSKLLERKGVKHEVLNAKQHEREAVVIAQAGRYGSVTIATNMAGRGVDILLGGNAEGIARDRLRKQGLDLTQAPKEVWETELAQAEAEVAEDKKKVVALGGLHVVGTERHEARRIDNQLRGRCARQGDPGSARFFVSLDDELMRRFGGERVKGLMDRMKLEDDVPLEYGILSKSIEQAQEKVEGYNFDVRKHVIQYDDVINKQREVIYHQRRTILEKDDLRDDVMQMIEEQIKAMVTEHTQGDLPENWDLMGLANEARTILPLPKDFKWEAWAKGTRDEIIDQLDEISVSRYDAGLRDTAANIHTQVKLANLTLTDMKSSREMLLRCIDVWLRKTLDAKVVADLEAAKTGLNDLPESMRDEVAEAFQNGVRLYRDRSLMIQTVDQYWIRHLTDLDELREGIGLRAYGQRDPLVAYRQEASNTYAELLDQIRETVVQRIFSVQIAAAAAPAATQQRATPARTSAPLGGGQPRPAPSQLRASGGSSAAAAPKPVAKGGVKVGRNDVCPWCNSGKKVKHCDCEGARKFRGEI